MIGIDINLLNKIINDLELGAGKIVLSEPKIAGVFNVTEGCDYDESGQRYPSYMTFGYEMEIRIAQSVLSVRLKGMRYSLWDLFPGSRRKKNLSFLLKQLEEAGIKKPHFWVNGKEMITYVSFFESCRAECSAT